MLDLIALTKEVDTAFQLWDAGMQARATTEIIDLLEKARLAGYEECKQDMCEAIMRFHGRPNETP